MLPTYTVCSQVKKLEWYDSCEYLTGSAAITNGVGVCEYNRGTSRRGLERGKGTALCEVSVGVGWLFVDSPLNHHSWRAMITSPL